MPIVLSSLSERVESVRAQEIFNYATYDQPQTLFEVMGFGKPPGSIVDVVQTGFMIGDRLLRPAMVTVARRGDIPPPIDAKA